MNSTISRSWINRCYFFFCAGLLLAGQGQGQIYFTDVTDEIGVYLIGTRSPTFGDFNNDGRVDMFCSTYYNDFSSSGIQQGTEPFLFNNEGNGQFGDVTENIQVSSSPDALGGGAVFGDYDNDGDLDLFVPAGPWQSGGVRVSRLYRNDRGLFIDVTDESGIEVQHSYTDNAVWFDYDRDGYLDLYVGRVVFKGEFNLLFHNNGDGTFSDLTQTAGLDIPLGSDGDGSNGGIGSGDLNDDGWPDLYVGVYEDRNRLFLNDHQGGFRDATTGDIGDPGAAYGVAVGDIDNDGDLDLFQAGGGDIERLWRSAMLLNLGEGDFLDVTEAVGLSAYAARQTLGPALGDIDNDGDLDLLTAEPFSLFLNDGGGIFEDRTSQAGITDTGNSLALADYDQDGFLDIWFGNDADRTTPPWHGKLYRNNGNDNHWLRVEPVGAESNRSGIGARLTATTGDLRQTREVLGGEGYNQHEMVAHFGLGQHTRVDRLEIRWLSGQVDVLTDISADQKIRVIEGSRGYHPVHPATWEHDLPDSIATGAILEVAVQVRPSLFEPGAAISGVSADLSSFGGDAEIPLTREEDGVYRLESRLLSLDRALSGIRSLSILIDQQTSLGPHWTRLSKSIVLFPGKDLSILDEGLAVDWEMEGIRLIDEVDLLQTDVVYRGDAATAVHIGSKVKSWSMTFLSQVPIDTVGYAALRFAFHPGELIGTPVSFTMGMNGQTTRIWGENQEETRVDLNRREWQLVEIPLEEATFFGRTRRLGSVTLTGRMGGTFYLDDLRLVARQSPVTAVQEERSASLPETFDLQQNYPNPFNSSTVIRFALPTTADVKLSIFNLTGQQIATLADGIRATGTYTLHWDGRNDDDQPLASGVYLYRLQTGDGQQQMRKLLLLH